MDVRIGVTYSPKELTVELDNNADLAKLKKEIDAALDVTSKPAVLWLTDRRGRQIGVPTDKVAYVEIGSPEADRRIGFSG